MAIPLANFVRSLVSWLVAALLVCVCVGGLYVFFRADEDLRRRVEWTLAEMLPEHSVTLSSARYVKGEGIHLRGLSIVQSDSLSGSKRNELAYCKEAELHCELSIQQLMQEQLVIDHVLVRGLIVNAERQRDGSWNLESLIPKQPKHHPLPALTIDDAKIEVVDRISYEEVEFSIKDVEATVTPEKDSEGRHRLAMRAHGSNQHVRQVECQGWFDPRTFSWALKGRIADLDYGQGLVRTLPTSLSQSLHDLDGLRARLQLEFGAAQGGDEPQPRFWITAKLTEGRIESPKLPESITELSIESIRYANYGEKPGWLARNVHAHYGTARLAFTAGGANLRKESDLRIRGNVFDLNLTRKFREILPRTQQLQWDKYQPVGLVDSSFLIDRTNGRWSIEAATKCRDVALICSYFRYRLLHARGTVFFRQDEKLTVDLMASTENATKETDVKIDANIDSPGPDFRGTIQVKTDWVPINDAIGNALPSGVSKILRDMSTRGEANFHALFWRNEQTDGSLRKDIKVEVRNAALQHQTFPYPLQQVSGRIHITEQLWTFDEFVAHNDSCLVRCSGNWFPGPAPAGENTSRGELRLGFIATNIPCDAELRQALPVGPRQIWKSLRPSGNIDHAEIQLLHRTGWARPKLDVVVRQLDPQDTPDRRGLQMQPTWFPLPMHRVTGVVDYKNDGTFHLYDLRAEQGSEQRPVVLQAPNQNKKDGLVPAGTGIFRADGTWDIHLNRLLADGVEMTPEIIAALPASLATGLRQLQFKGKLSLDGGMRFAGNSAADSTIRSSWSSQVNIDDGSLLLAGESIQNIYGQISVVGQTNGADWKNSGRAHFDSLNLRDTYVSNVNTPWGMDASGLRFGAEAAAATGQRPEHLTAAVFGGAAQADGMIGLSADNPFRVDMVMTDFDVEEVARDLGAPTNITGRGQARLQINGSAEGTHTLGGRGSIALREAKLAKLPAIIEILNNLKIRNAPPDVFSSGNINFTVEGPYLNLSRFDLHGESLSLKGRGWLALDRRLDIAFYSILGGEKSWLKPLRPMLGQASQQLLQIRVSGSVDNPQWSRKVLPGLNDLFPEQVRAAAVDRGRR